MKLITERDEIRTVAARWAMQYSGPHWQKQKDKVDIGAALRALDPEAATREQIASIIGNDGWVRTDCDECGRTKKTVIHIGEEPDYETRWQQLCAGCVTKALRLLDAA